MNLEKAIEILTDQYKRHKVGGDLNYRDAIKLGIEGLSYIDICQKNPNCFNISLLPGQTLD